LSDFPSQIKNPESRIKNGLSWRRNQFAVTAASFVGFTGFTLVMPFLPLYIRELGVQDEGEVALWTGLTLGVTPGLTALCAPFWGRVADRFGEKLMVERALFSFVIVMSAMAYATRPWHLLALRAALGLFSGYGALTLSMAARSVPRDRMAQAIGLVHTAQRLGPAIGPVIGGVLAPLAGLRNAFLIAAAVYGVAFCVVLFLYDEPAEPRARENRGGRMTFGTILAFENFILLMLVIFGLQFVDRSFGPVLPLYVEQRFPPESVPIVSGVLFSVLAFAAAAGNQVAGRLLRTMTARAVIASASLVGAAGLAVFALQPPLWGLVAAMALFGVCIGVASTSAYTAAGGVIPQEVHATGFSFLTSASLVGLALSPVVSGFVAAHSVRAVFISGVLMLVLLAFVVRRLMVERAPTTSAPAVEEA
jgi:DHA1 family multidrug resistance protein-like MFS transporter